VSQLDFHALITAAIAVCQEAVSGSESDVRADASNEATPYFYGRIAPGTFDKPDSDEIDQYEFDLVIVHVSGNRTEGIPGEGDEILYDDMAAVIEALLSRDLLQYATSPTALDWLQEADLTACAGYAVLDGKSIGAAGDQIGTTYTIHCIARLDNVLDYE
jgi:hypothetical protein